MLHATLPQLCFHFNVQDVGKVKPPREGEGEGPVPWGGHKGPTVPWGGHKGPTPHGRRPMEEDAGVAETKKMIADMIAQDKANEKLAQLALHNPHIWANSLKPVCFLCFLLFWCPLLPVIETGTLKIYTKMVLYMKNEFFDLKYPLMGFEPTLYKP